MWLFAEPTPALWQVALVFVGFTSLFFVVGRLEELERALTRRPVAELGFVAALLGRHQEKLYVGLALTAVIALLILGSEDLALGFGAVLVLTLAIRSRSRRR